MAEEQQIARVEQQFAVAEVPLGPPVTAHVWFVTSCLGLVLGFVAKTSVLWAVGIGGGALFAFYAGWAVFAKARFRRFQNETMAALAALNRGELAKARDAFVRWSKSRDPMISGLARHALSGTLALGGRIEEGVTLIEDTANCYATSLARVGVLSTTRADASFYNALAGKLEPAASWLEKAREPLPRPSVLTFPGMLAIAEAVLACRTGRACNGAG